MSDTLYIRADMNAEISTGHVMRCLSIADAASGMGAKAVFICADDQPKELIESFGAPPLFNSRDDEIMLKGFHKKGRCWERGCK